MKKLVTVAWATTVEIELPEEIGLEELTDWQASTEIEELASKAAKEAFDNISWKGGEITDVQDS